jgi:hypothetical protein
MSDNPFKRERVRTYEIRSIDVHGDVIDIEWFSDEPSSARCLRRAREAFEEMDTSDIPEAVGLVLEEVIFIGSDAEGVEDADYRVLARKGTFADDSEWAVDDDD